MAILVLVEPLDGVTGTRTAIGFADSDDERLTGLNNIRWWPGVSSAPALNREGWNGSFDNGVFLPQAAVNVNLEALRRHNAAAPAFRWSGAPFTVYRGEPGQAWASFELLFDGLCLNGAIDGGLLKLTAQVDSDPFEEKVLTLVYEGRGGNTGHADLADRAKPAVFGNAENVEPVAIDTVNNVFQVHGYGPIQAFRTLYERGVNFGPALANYASYATLLAATIPEGKWATCLAEGMFRLGAPPYGVITCDVSGDNTGGFHQTTAAIMRRLCAIAAVPTIRLDDASLNSFAAAVPYPINLYQTTATKLIDVLSMLALPCNAHATLSWLGKFQVTRFAGIPAATISFDVQGRQLPPVLDNSEVTVSAPFHRIEFQYNRAWRVQTKDELVLEENLVVVPKTVWRAYPEMPPLPVGSDTPAGWLDTKPELSPPNVVNGKIMFGPTWVSNANQKGGVTEIQGWSEPVLDDSRYKGWVMAGVRDEPASLGGADSMRVDAAAFGDARYITDPIAGGWRLRWTVFDSDTRAMVGVTSIDPALQGAFLGPGHIQVGVAICPTVASFGLADPGIYPFTNTTIGEGFGSTGYARSHLAVPSRSTYLMSCNGEIVDIYVNGQRVRSFALPDTMIGHSLWPIFYLEGWTQSFGTDSDIYAIEWSGGAPGRVLDYPIKTLVGGLRRMQFEQGWETNVPFFPTNTGSPAATLSARDFFGGGAMEATVSNTAGIGTSALTLQSGATNVGRIELSSNGAYAIKLGSSTKRTGIWVDGDTWGIRYLSRRLYVYKNGTQLYVAKVARGSNVTPTFEFDQHTNMWNIRVTPENEEAYVYKGSVIATAFPVITDASPQNAGGFAILGTSADLAYSPSDTVDGDELVVKATYHYYWFSGGVYTATSYLPDARVEISYNAGGVWSEVAGTWAPALGSATQSGPNVAASIFTATAGPIFVTAVGTIRCRLVAKNTQTGTYSITPLGSSYVSVEWQA